MFRKNYLIVFLAALALLMADSAVLAQGSSPVRGVVKLKKADGTVVPVPDAVVDAYRTDIDKGKMPSAKTNKRGEFSFVGFPLGQRFVLAVSGPGIGPQIQPDVKGGMENIELIVNEGDGRQYSEAEIRSAERSSAGAPPTSGMSEAQKKERAELEKKNAEITASNKKAEDVNKTVNASLQAGNAAFKAANYDQAISEFDQGFAADPEFAGSAPVFLNLSGLSHVKRALVIYKAEGQAGKEKIKLDLDSAFTAYGSGLDILKKASPAEAAEQKNRDNTKLAILTNLLDVHGIAAKLLLDDSKSAQANAVFEEYAATETDPARKTATLLNYGANMNGAGQLKNAIAAYRKMLELDPSNVDALAGLGLALYSEGAADPAAPDKAILQEGLNYMQRFVDTAPETHKLKQSIKETIEELKNEQKLTPQKTAPAKRKG